MLFVVTALLFALIIAALFVTIVALVTVAIAARILLSLAVGFIGRIAVVSTSLLPPVLLFPANVSVEKQRWWLMSGLGR